MGSIIVAVICNLIALLILFNGIFNALGNGWKVSLTKFALLFGCLIGAYFLTPFLSDKLLSISYNEITIAEPLTSVFGMGVINSFIFTFVFSIFYVTDTMICGILRYQLINSLKEKSENKAKLKRARSINAKAEKLAKNAAWKALESEFKAQNTWWKKLISCLLGFLTAVVAGVVVLLPYGYIAEKLNSNGDKKYLEQGYDYTLNGVIDDKFEGFFDWVISYEAEKEESVPESDEGVGTEVEDGEEAPGTDGAEA